MSSGCQVPALLPSSYFYGRFVGPRESSVYPLLMINPPLCCLQPLHHEISLYIQQLKIDMEEGKLRDNIAKLEKQINKEKKLIRRGKTRGLAKEHEVKAPHSHCCLPLCLLGNHRASSRPGIGCAVEIMLVCSYLRTRHLWSGL